MGYTGQSVWLWTSVAVAGATASSSVDRRECGESADQFHADFASSQEIVLRGLQVGVRSQWGINSNCVVSCV